MTSSIRTTVALGPAIDRRLVEAVCDGQPGIDITGFVEAGHDSLGYLDDYSGDAILVVCREDSPDLVQFIQGAVAQSPARPVIVHYEGSANGFVRSAFDAGAEDLVTGSLSNGAGVHIAFALEKAIARRGGMGSEAGLGDLIPVLGPKGGTGKTLIACNLGVALASRGQRVVLVDLDLQFGDVGLSLGLRPDRTIFELALSGGSLDPEKVEDFLVRHESGLQVLLAPRRPDQAASVSVPFLEKLFATLRATADCVIVDTPPSFAPEVIAAIDASTKLLVVATLDALSLKNTRLALETLDLMDYEDRRIKVVLNRAATKVGVTHEDAGQLLGREPDVLVPSSREIARAVNEARPIVASSGSPDERRAFETLANVVSPPPVVENARRKSLLQRRKGS